MAELSMIENHILVVMKEIGATKETATKTQQEIVKKSNRPDALITNTLSSLIKKGVVKRTVKDNKVGYYITGK